MSATAHWPCPNNCHLWVRGITPSAPMTLHNPQCEHVNTTLIDVWRVSIPGESTGCICETEDEAKAMIDGDPEVYEITKIKMHREIFDNLAEFAGF